MFSCRCCCSSGNHAPSQSVTWTGILNTRRQVLGVKLSFAYAPGEYKILASGDGANFEEAQCWKTSSRAEVSYEESRMFAVPRAIKALTIVFRTPMMWGYYGLNSAILIVAPGPLMLVSGLTSRAGEQCFVAVGTDLALEPCLLAISAGDGRDIFQFNSDGQLFNAACQKCVSLADGNTAHGGNLVMEQCRRSAETGDGRSFLTMQTNGQLKLERVGNFCLTISGSAQSEAMVGSDVTATSTQSGHPAADAVGGNQQS